MTGKPTRKDLEQRILILEEAARDARRLQEALQDKENEYRILVENATDTIYRTDALGRFTFFNPAAVKLTGYAQADLIGKPYTELVRSDCRAEAQRFYGHQFVHHIPITYYEFPMLTKNQAEIWIGQHVQLIIDDGQATGFCAIARDITDRKKMEEALRESEARHRQSEERYRNILDNMEEAYYEVDLKGNLTFFNHTAVKNLGYTDEVLMGMNFREYVDDKNARKVQDAYGKVFLTGESIKGIDWELISKESGQIPVESSISLNRDSQGTPIGFRGIIRDITERKHAEDALHDSVMRFRNLMETAHDVIITIDVDGIITYVNPASKVITGGVDIVGMPLKDFLPPDLVSQHVDMLESYREGFCETLSYEWKFTQPRDERSLCFDVKSSSLMEKGKPSGVLFVARDATERKRTEEEIRLMAIIDTLTGLYNRRGFIALAEQQMKIAVRNDKKLLLFFADLDDLKYINDTWGHDEGDNALTRTSLILKKTFRASDIISRLGGDEFAALVPDSSELPEVILQRLQDRINDEKAVSDLPYQISMSIGVADYDPSAPCSIHELMSRADQLMYAHKKEKKQKGEHAV